MKRVILSIAAIVISLLSWSYAVGAQSTGSVTGITYQSNVCGDTSVPIAGFDISLVRNGSIERQVQSDANGSYTIDNLELDVDYELVTQVLDGGSDSRRHTPFRLTASKPDIVRSINVLTCVFTESLWLPILKSDSMGL